MLVFFYISFYLFYFFMYIHVGISVQVVSPSCTMSRDTEVFPRSAHFATHCRGWMCISAADSEMLEFGVPRRSNSYVPVKGYYIQARLKGHRTRGCSRGEYIHFFLTHHPQAGSFPMSWVYEDQAHRVWCSMHLNLESVASVSYVCCDWPVWQRYM